MPGGKPAGIACVHLDEDYRCGLFGRESRPEVCRRFQAGEELCGTTREQALERLHWLEQKTR
jgi:hypothetical protein